MSNEPRHTNGERDDIATLLRVAGRRRSIPEERARRVRAAVETHWAQQSTQRRRWISIRRITWVAAALFTLLTAGFLLKDRIGVPMLDEVALVTVERMKGSVSLEVAGSVTPLTGDQSISMGSTLITDPGSALALRLPSGHSLRVADGSHVRLIDEARLAVEQGAVYLDSRGHDVRNPSLVVETAFGEVREIGTQFEVRLLERSIRLRLREGAVLMAHESELDEVMAGTEYELFADGRSRTAPIAPDSTEWDWVQAIAPMLDFEGRTAREFLDWSARERGLRLAFTDEATAQAADETILRGSTSVLTPERALDDLLSTCGMSYDIERGALIVSSD